MESSSTIHVPQCVSEMNGDHGEESKVIRLRNSKQPVTVVVPLVINLLHD